MNRIPPVAGDRTPVRQVSQTDRPVLSRLLGADLSTAPHWDRAGD